MFEIILQINEGTKKVSRGVLSSRLEWPRSQGH